MRLTRRDAVAALGAAGVAVGGGAVLLGDGDVPWESDGASSDLPVREPHRRTLVAAAEVLYPSAVEDVATFVTDYVRGRASDSPAHGRAMADAAGYVDSYVRSWEDRRFAALDLPDREAALREMGADTAAGDPDGSDVERVRYYVVDELLFALYATPTGGALVGIENPQGHPGGLATYQRGPRS